MHSSRLDAVLVERGFARSRSHAAQLLERGLVTLDGRPVVKASTKVSVLQDVVVRELDGYVGRAAYKLLAALDAWDDLAVEGREALDLGASTGGFTQVLLERGANRVVALDVGHGQLAPSIRADQRVDVVEGFNARNLSREALDGAVGRPVRPQVVVADLSFISLSHVLPAAAETVGEGADWVVLVKPQFEVGRGGVREGIVRDPALREDAVTAVLWSAWDAGLRVAGLLPSPILGGAGNHEYLLRLRSGEGADPTEWRDRVHELCAAP